MKKRLTSLILAAAMAIPVVSSMSASANVIIGSEAEAEEYTCGDWEYAPELIELVTQIDGMNGEYIKEYFTKNLWISQDFNEGLVIYGEKIVDDYIRFYFSEKPEELPDISAILKENIGYDDKFTITEETEDYDGTLKVTVNFLTNEHRLNYMIAEKAAAVIKDYSDCYGASFGQVSFADYRLLMPNAPLQKKSEIEALTEEDFENYNKILEENGIRVRYLYEPIIIDKTIEDDDLDMNGQPRVRKLKQYAYFPDDMTLEEQLEYILFVQENFNCPPSVYSECSLTVAGYSNRLTSEDISWLDGDANEDGKVNIADAAFVMQTVGNKDKYSPSERGRFNADSDGNGLTALDALRIQKRIAGIE